MKADGSNATAQVAKVQRNPWESWFAQLKNAVAPSIPAETVSVDRFIESAKMALFDPKVPDLVKCTPESIKRSFIQAANYGLEVGGVLGQSYIIPYNENVRNPATGNWEKKMTCHFQMGYKGLIALARRSKTIKTIAAECIYENDTFDCNLASGRSITHKMNIFEERGEVIGYYCLVELTNGGEQFAVMSKKDAEKFRDTYSKSYIMAKDKSTQNWGKNFDAMALKTCVIKALKLCPISIEALRAVQTEEAADYNDTNVTANEAVSETVTKIATEKNKAEATVIEQPVQYEMQNETVNQPTQNMAAQAINTNDFDDAGMNAAFDNGYNGEPLSPDFM